MDNLVTFNLPTIVEQNLLKLSLLYPVILKYYFKFLCKSIKCYFNKQDFPQLLSIFKS